MSSQALKYSELESFSTSKKRNNTFKNRKKKLNVNSVLKSMEGEGLKSMEGGSPTEDFEPYKTDDTARLPSKFPPVAQLPVQSQPPQPHYIPYYTNASNQGGSNDQLIEKLNYMIHLLEEEKDEKTSNITEELILYLFLGVFVIFVVDSFARAGKYTR